VDEERPTAGRGLRRFTLGSGPLKRTSDRIEFLARILLVCTLAMTFPVALAVASVTHAQALAEATAQSLERQRVDAVLVEDPVVRSSPTDVPRATSAPATWRGPSGTEHTGLVVVPTGARAGATVPIWVDRDGNLTTRPLDDEGAVAEAAGMAGGTYLLIAALAVGVHVLLLAALDRSRLRRWAADWAVIEPVWTRRVS
jgi:hypothetical protein